MVKRPSLYSAIGILTLSLLLNQPVWADSTSENQALLDRVVELEGQVKDLSQKAANNGYASNVITTSNGSTAISSNISPSDMETRLSSLENQLRILTGQLEQANYQTQQTNLALKKLSGDMDFRMQQLEQRQGYAGGMTAPPPVAMATDPNAPITNTPGTQALMMPPGTLITNNTVAQPPALNQDTPATPEELYNRAYSEMQRKEYVTSQQDFKSFLASNPNHKLAPNAQYWLGEIYYAQGNYKLASATFADGYQKFPKGPKAPDNLLKLGLSLEQQDRTKDACTVLRQLTKDYPAAPDTITSSATRGIKRMQCSI